MLSRQHDAGHCLSAAQLQQNLAASKSDTSVVKIAVPVLRSPQGRRKRKHQHLFMMDEEAKAVTAGDSSLKLAVSKVPIEDWTALLESGWGNIEGTRLRYA
jgi:hypothetical protein